MEDVEMDGEAWLEHQYLYTYRIADRVQELAENHTAHFGDLESLTADFGIAEFIRPWQPDSALHKFIRYAADDLMESDNTGTVKMSFWDRSRSLRWTVPIELALTSYGLQDNIRFTLANIPQIHETIGNTTYARDAPEVSDACFDHFQSVRLTQPYTDFLHQVSEEVFFVMFTNRGTLQKLHEYLAYYVTENDYTYVLAEHPALVTSTPSQGGCNAEIRRNGLAVQYSSGIAECAQPAEETSQASSTPWVPKTTITSFRSPSVASTT
ncbi:hypothetical protein NQP46_20765 [Streptomyces albus]|nr:hypothetical protein NQP46_20765 [Streptomyces albus]